MTINEHVNIQGKIKIDPTAAFNMQGITDAIKLAYPSDPTLTVVSIDVPLLNIACKEFGLINPIEDIKEAAARIYNAMLTKIVKPIYELLYRLMNILSLGSLSKLKLPVLDLTIDDLFKDNIFDILYIFYLSIHR